MSSAYGQDAHGTYGQDAHGNDLPTIEVTLPPIEISLQDIIDVLIEFTVVQETGNYFCTHFYGLTDFDVKSISICAKYDITAKRKTILHEVLHVVYWKHGVYTGGPYERKIDTLATEMFRKLYGLSNRVSADKDTGIDKNTGAEGNAGTVSPTGITITGIAVGPIVPATESAEQE